MNLIHLHYKELKNNRKLSEFFARATETEEPPDDEDRLLKAMSQDDRQQYHMLKFQLDHAKAELIRIKPIYKAARASAEKRLAIIETDIKVLKQKYLSQL